MDQTTPTTELSAKLTKQQILDRCNQALDEYRSRQTSLEEERARLLAERKTLTDKANTLERDLRRTTEHDQTLSSDLKAIVIAIEAMMSTVHNTTPTPVPHYVNGVEQPLEPASQEVRFLRHLWNLATSHSRLPF